MTDIFVPLLLLTAFSMLGVLLGTITGLVPGFHPNNVAFILLSFSPVIVTEPRFLTAFAPPEMIPVLVASTILAASIAHTFLSFIPAAFIGAPEGDTALCLLPAHRLLLEGRAYESTVLSVIGSFGAVIFSFLFLIPFYFLISVLHCYEILQSHILYVLITSKIF
jgi:putative membrane protein